MNVRGDFLGPPRGTTSRALICKVKRSPETKEAFQSPEVKRVFQSTEMKCEFQRKPRNEVSVSKPINVMK